MATNEQVAAWTDKRVTELRQLWSEGWSATQIGLRFGIGRNAVIGKVHRLNLPKRRTTTKVLNQKMAQKRRWGSNGLIDTTVPQLRELSAKMKSAPVFPVEPLPMEEPGAGGGFTLLELENHMCRWPSGDAPFTFCGADRIAGSSYCCAHDARSRAGRPKPLNIHPSETRENNRRAA